MLVYSYLLNRFTACLNHVSNTKLSPRVLYCNYCNYWGLGNSVMIMTTTVTKPIIPPVTNPSRSYVITYSNHCFLL
ncbi:hypothetical protein M6B38_220745 [Iris pallida]|uniref:Uncharacterized protein n=1 Tax=Iris pallida TaxID=29817 RepID=A0AAX6DYN4_IRIPA|nr:hypothetical protein M6B38_220745 [Iris pallida]